jgi:hypothetical protein
MRTAFALAISAVISVMLRFVTLAMQLLHRLIEITYVRPHHFADLNHCRLLLIAQTFARLLFLVSHKDKIARFKLGKSMLS